MKRKLVVCFFAMVMLFGLSSVSMANPINDPVYFDEITLISTSPTFTFTSLTHGTFETFCLERYENIQIGQTYIAYSNAGAVKGGVPSGFNPVNPETAYLFTDWKYHLSGTVYNDAALGMAIWILQDQISEADALAKWGSYAMKLANGYIALAAAQDWTSTHGVVALNDYTLKGGLAQDMLYVPEPMSLLLLGFGLLGLGITRRKLKK
jgi:hypothetical protein